MSFAKCLCMILFYRGTSLANILTLFIHTLNKVSIQIIYTSKLKRLYILAKITKTFPGKESFINSRNSVSSFCLFILKNVYICVWFATKTLPSKTSKYTKLFQQKQSKRTIINSPYYYIYILSLFILREWIYEFYCWMWYEAIQMMTNDGSIEIGGVCLAKLVHVKGLKGE